MEANKLYVANISFEASEGDLKSLFEAYGTVEQLHYAHDRDTGRPRGFGFVTMSSVEEAQAAINALNGHALKDRNLFVSVARPREEKPREPNKFRRSGPPDRRESRPPRAGNPESRPPRPNRSPAPEEQQAPRLDGGHFEGGRHSDKGKDSRRNTVFRTHDEEWPKGHKPKKRFDQGNQRRKSRNSWDDEEDDY